MSVVMSASSIEMPEERGGKGDREGERGGERKRERGREKESRVERERVCASTFSWLALEHFQCVSVQLVGQRDPWTLRESLEVPQLELHHRHPPVVRDTLHPERPCGTHTFKWSLRIWCTCIYYSRVPTHQPWGGDRLESDKLSFGQVHMREGYCVTWGGRIHCIWWSDTR